MANNNSEFPKRGEVYHIKAPNHDPIGAEIWGERPGVVISNDIHNKLCHKVSIAYMSTKHSRWYKPTMVEISTGEHPSYVLCDQIYTIDTARLGQRIYTLSESNMNKVTAAINLHLMTSMSNPSAYFHKWEQYIQANRLDLLEEQENIISDEQVQIHNTLLSTIKELRNELDAYKILAETRLNTIERLHKMLDETNNNHS